MKTNLLTWLNRNAKGAMSFMKVLQSKVLLSSFNSHLQLLLSMLLIAVEEKFDGYILPTKLTIAYLISLLKTPTIYNWSVAIFDEISQQLQKIDEVSHFAYASYIVWLFIHQNSDFFTRLTLVKHYESGSLKFARLILPSLRPYGSPHATTQTHSSIYLHSWSRSPLWGWDRTIGGR